jgi:hypothetical protein
MSKQMQNTQWENQNNQNSSNEVEDKADFIPFP